uniref:Uncharacterized protein n=1 Tax=Lygus hesperus TaxID=30085 RepID=A0A0A9VZ59_LYGHE
MDSPNTPSTISAFFGEEQKTEENEQKEETDRMEEDSQMVQEEDERRMMEEVEVEEEDVLTDEKPERDGPSSTAQEIQDDESKVTDRSRSPSKNQVGVAFDLKEEPQSLDLHNVADSEDLNENSIIPGFGEEVGITESEMEEWGFYDENEGQELEDALDESVERFARDMEELESVGQRTKADVQFASFSAEEEEEMSGGEAIKDDSVMKLARKEISRSRSTVKRTASVPVTDSPSAISSARESGVLQLQTRQGGLLDVRTEGSVVSESTESEMTWPRTPMTEADDIIREYLPGLYSETSAVHPEPTESVTVDLESPLVLESENPMKAKFQEILKEHLLRQISRIKEQITQIDADTKRLVDESKLRADSVYREDRFVQKQREDIEAYRANIEQIQSQREAFEKELEDVRGVHLQMKQDYNQTKRLDEGLIKEREMLNDLVHKMRAYEAEKGQNLKTSQAVDLEMCITRRDRLLDNAEAREVRSQATGKQWSRMQVQRKMNDLKNKIQTLKRKNQMMNREQLDLSYQLAETREEYNNIKSGIDTLRVNLEELERQMEEGQLHKHACLESTLYRQKKAKYLEDYKFGRYRCVNRTPGALAAEEEKQNHLMNTLRTVLDNLLNDFPQLNLQIAQIMNTLEPVFPDQRESENGETRDLHAPELLTSLSDRKFVARKSEYHLISDLALVRPQTVWGDAEEVQRTT